jgi:hypothetical protein
MPWSSAGARPSMVVAGGGEKEARKRRKDEEGAVAPIPGEADRARGVRGGGRVMIVLGGKRGTRPGGGVRAYNRR